MPVREVESKLDASVTTVEESSAAEEVTSTTEEEELIVLLLVSSLALAEGEEVESGVEVTGTGVWVTTEDESVSFVDVRI